MEDDDKSWLVTTSELDESSKDARIEYLERTVSYLVNAKDTEELQQRIKQEYAKVKRNKAKKTLLPSSGFIKVHKLINQKAVIDHMFKPGEERMLFKLIPFCNLESNFICDTDGLPMNQKAIIKLTGMSKNDVIEIMDSLMEYGVLQKFVSGKSVFYKFSKEWIDV